MLFARTVEKPVAL